VRLLSQILLTPIFKLTINVRRAVLAIREGGSSKVRELRMFRSYNHDNSSNLVVSPGPAAIEPIWQIARAVSAAPTYFSPIEVDGDMYYDAGLGFNNPTMAALQEVVAFGRMKRRLPKNVKEQHNVKLPDTAPYPGQEKGVSTGMETAKGKSVETVKNEAPHSQMEGKPRISPDQEVALVISIGTGMRRPASGLARSWWFDRLKAVFSIALESVTDAEQTNLNGRFFCETHEIPYFRFNVDTGLEHIALDDDRSRLFGLGFLFPCVRKKTKRTLSKIEVATHEYLSQEDVRKELWAAAEALVKYRRLRIPPEITPFA
jgi:hypothetical protein